MMETKKNQKLDLVTFISLVSQLNLILSCANSEVFILPRKLTADNAMEISFHSDKAAFREQPAV